MQNEKVIRLRQDKPDPYDTVFMDMTNERYDRLRRSATHSAHAKAERRHRLMMGALVVATWIGTLLWVASV